MIRIEKSGNDLLLKYYPDPFQGGGDWISKKFSEDDTVRIAKVFHFGEDDLIGEEQGEWTFQLGRQADDYYRIDKDILNISHDLRIHSACSIIAKMFIASRGLSVFRTIDSLLSEPITVGGSEENSIPESEFRALLEQFPTHTELNHYVSSRLTRILKDYFESTTDAQTKFERFLSNKRGIETVSREPLSREYELEKYKFIREELGNMLQTPDAYVEKAWQSKIVQFLLLIFPKYIAVLDNLHIKDFYSEKGKVKNRYIDLTLVDVNGHIDVIEIKRPYSNALVSKGRYRDNFTPKKELAGSVMQIEKYIFHLNKWGQAGESEINKKRQHELPEDLSLKVTNPKGMVILGREDDLSESQKFDLEFMKRKYANIIDIMTYDDLLRRLGNIIEMLGRRGGDA